MYQVNVDVSQHQMRREHRRGVYYTSQKERLKLYLIFLLVVFPEISVKYQYVLISVACHQHIALPVYVSKYVTVVFPQSLNRYDASFFIFVFIKLEDLAWMVLLTNNNIFQELRPLDHFDEGVRADRPDGRLCRFGRILQ